MKKAKLMMLLFLCMINTRGITQVKQNNLNFVRKTAADFFWETRPVFDFKSPRIDGSIEMISIPLLYQLPELSTEEDDKNYEESVINYSVYKEIFFRLYWEWGIIFWERFPKDSRRFLWFRSILYINPVYFRDISEDVKRQISSKYGVVPIDTIAKQRWNKFYLRFRQEYMASSDVNESDKKEFIKQEIIGSLVHGRWRAEQSDKFDFLQWVNQVIDYGSKYEGNELVPYMTSLFSNKEDYGLNDQDLKHLIKILDSSKVPSYKKFAMQKANLMALVEQPFEFKGKTFRGMNIDINSYKGKLTLIDFWSLGCTVCINKMPEIKKVYEKYRGEGFEVIAVCFMEGKSLNGEDIYPQERKQIQQIYKKIGAQWPLVLLERPEVERHPIWNTYGFNGVPQLLLLNEKGNLIHYNGIMFQKGGLEQLVKEHLKIKQLN